MVGPTMLMIGFTRLSKRAARGMSERKTATFLRQIFKNS